MPTVSTLALVTLYSVVFVDFVQISFLWPLLPKIVSVTFGRGIFEIGLLGSAAAFGEAIGAPWLGNFADIYGRRHVLVISGFGCCLCSVAVALAPTYECLVAARLLTGLCGSSVGVAIAYVADSTTEEERPRYINYCMAALFLGLAAGPIGGAALEQAMDYRLACYGAALLCFVNVLMVLFLLPNSTKAEVKQEDRTPSAICMACIFPCGGLPAQAYCVGAAGFFGGAGFAAFEALGVLFLTDTMFEGDIDAATRYYGLLVSVVGVVGLVGTLFFYDFFLGSLKKCMQFNSALKASIFFGGGIGLLSFFVMGSTVDKVFWFVAVLVMVLGDNVSSPSTQTIITLLVEPTQFGKAMGMMTLCGNTARAFGPFIVAPIYDLGGRDLGWVWWHSAPWFLNAIFKFFAIFFVMLVKMRAKAPQPEADSPMLKRTESEPRKAPVAGHEAALFSPQQLIRSKTWTSGQNIYPNDRRTTVIRGQAVLVDSPVPPRSALLSSLGASLQPLQAPAAETMPGAKAVPVEP